MKTEVDEDEGEEAKEESYGNFCVRIEEERVENNYTCRKILLRNNEIEVCSFVWFAFFPCMKIFTRSVQLMLIR